MTTLSRKIIKAKAALDNCGKEYDAAIEREKRYETYHLNAVIEEIKIPKSFFVLMTRRSVRSINNLDKAKIRLRKLTQTMRELDKFIFECTKMP